MSPQSSFPARFVKRGGLFVGALVVVIGVRLALTIASYPKARAFVPHTAERYAHRAMAWRLARAVSAAARFVPGATCLTQALSLRLLLAMRGYASEMHVGVTRDDSNRFTAHAWLVSDGQIVIGGTEAELSKYSRLTEFSARSL